MKVLASIVFSFLSLAAIAQSNFDFTTAANRRQHDKRLRDTVILQSLAYRLSPATENEWLKAFWAMELMLYKTPATKAKLAQAWQKVNTTSERFQKALLEVSYTLYPSSFDGNATALMNITASPAIFIRCAEYLLLTPTATKKSLIQKLITQKFPGNDFIGLQILLRRISPLKPKLLPPLKDIFSTNFLPGQTIIYSLQRSNRAYPGLVIIRKPDGSFVKNVNGAFFYTTQLARAVSNYPFYITNGNTPQGIFRFTGFDTSEIDYIGPTTNLQMVMPFETAASVFMNDTSYTGSKISIASYSSLLPPSWKDYDGIYESFYAGAIGRSEIIMHGTTINPSYYVGQTYYPQTPSLGCLCSYEEWNRTGQRTVSNQQKIVEALNAMGSTNGYVVVIDLDNKRSAVLLKEVEELLR